MSATNIRQNGLTQVGNGVPNHMAIVGTLFLDLDTNYVYFNKNNSEWVCLVDNQNYNYLIPELITGGSYLTGGTYNNLSGSITFTNNSGGTLVISGITFSSTDTYITGSTFNNNILSLTNNSGLTLNTLFNNFSNISANTISATTFYGDGSNLTGIIAGSSADTFTTGTTLIGNTIYFHKNNQLSAYTVDLSSITATGGTSNTNGYMPQGW